MKKETFYAMLARMKYIDRWSLMRNAEHENVSEHSLEVAVIAHALAVISNVRLGNQWNVERAAMLGLFHDSTEILTGDMPTPVKYFNQDIREAYKKVEADAAQRLMDMLPEDMQSYYRPYFNQREEDNYLWKLEKAADRLSALIKCINEKKAGNTEFQKAYQSTLQSLEDMQMEEVTIFMNEFLPAYSKTLDELQMEEF